MTATKTVEPVQRGGEVPVMQPHGRQVDLLETAPAVGAAATQRENQP